MIFHVLCPSLLKHDRYLSKLQQFSLDALGPMVWLHEQMLSEGEVDPTKAKEAVEASIALLGSATAHFSMECRKSVMKHMNKDLRPLCEGDFPKRGPHLFGRTLDPRQRRWQIILEP